MKHHTNLREGKRMNMFFYAVQKSNTASEVLEWLRSLRPHLPVQVLPSGFGLRSKEAMRLRNGDLLVVYVRDQEELQMLIDSSDRYDNYMIYLIFKQHNPDLIKAGLAFNPKHYSSVEEQFIHTEETLRKILKKRT